MKGPRIAVIGAGGSFVIGLIHDLCLTPRLHSCRVTFMDPDQARLDASLLLCTRYAEERGVRLDLRATPDRREALREADFVITIALVDGARRMLEGWAIARKLGYQWGGSYHIMYDEPFWLNFYQLRLFESIVQEMQELCPKAMHLLVSNPVLAATTYLNRVYPRIPTIGLCHGFSGVFQIARILGLDEKSLVYEIPGVNHFVWLTHLSHKGEDVFPLIEAWIEKEAEAHWSSHGPDQLSRKRVDLYKSLGAIPIGDTANWTGASWPWWYHSSPDVERSWQEDSEGPWHEYAQGVRDRPARLREIAGDAKGSIAKAFHLGGEPTGEPMIPIVESVSCDSPRVLIVNILNTNDYVSGIPRDFEVEIPALVSAQGVQGIKTKGLPKPIIAHILRDRVAPVEMELEAYRVGSRELLRQLVLMDKWTQSVEHADRLIDEIFALPYHAELREHYR
jgi:alpha-galactosidase